MNITERMTDQQRLVKDESLKRAEELAIELYMRARNALQAAVALPHTNEQGLPVVHGCNMVMYRLSESFTEAGHRTLDVVMMYDIVKAREIYRSFPDLKHNQRAF